MYPNEIFLARNLKGSAITACATVVQSPRRLLWGHPTEQTERKSACVGHDGLVAGSSGSSGSLARIDKG